MSWQASRWARDQRTGSHAAKVVLMVLAESAGADDASCVLSTVTIGERTELGRTAVLKHLAELESAGLISRTRRVNDFGHRVSDALRLAVNGAALGPPNEPRDHAPDVQEPNAALGTPGGPRLAEPKVRQTDLGENPRSTSRRPKVHLTTVLGPPGGPPIDKGLLEGLQKGSGPLARQADVAAFWEITPKVGRERSSRKDIERALSAAVRRGHSAGDVLRGVKAYYASVGAMKDGGAFAKGCHRIIENDRWEAFAPPAPDEARASPPADPWRDRVKSFADPSNRYWNATDWGPAPGKPGSTVPAAILAEFGFGPEGVVPMRRKGAA